MFFRLTLCGVDRQTGAASSRAKVRAGHRFSFLEAKRKNSHNGSVTSAIYHPETTAAIRRELEEDLEGKKRRERRFNHELFRSMIAAALEARSGMP